MCQTQMADAVSAEDETADEESQQPEAGPNTRAVHRRGEVGCFATSSSGFDKLKGTQPVPARYCDAPILEIREMTHRNILTRCLASFALIAIYIVGSSALMVTTTTTTASARGRGDGGGRGRGDGGRGRGHGHGWGQGIYIAPPVYIAPPRCYWSRKWQRRICRY